MGQVFLALGFLLAVTALVAVCWRRRYLTVGWLWFLGTMVPMIGLVQVGRQSMADRYAYLPLLGLFILLCWGVADCVQAWHLPAALLPAISLAVLASLAVLTYRQVGYWADTVKLWSHTLEVTDRNWFAESYLGDALRYTGHQDEAALQHYSKSLEINPGNIEANLGLALYEHQTGNLRESVDYYKKFLAKAGGDERCYRVLINLGHVYRRLGDAERAQQYFEEAAKIAPKEHATLP